MSLPLATSQLHNSKVYLKNINFHVIGSANKGDIRNVKLLVNGTQVGATLATVGADGTAYFDASATPGILNTGSNNVQVCRGCNGLSELQLPVRDLERL